MTSPSAAWSAESDAFVQKAVTDLAARLQSSPADVEIISVVEIEWRDSSLGLPQPGRVYMQVITPGFQITLSAKGATYRYHAGQNQVLAAGMD